MAEPDTSSPHQLDEPPEVAAIFDFDGILFHPESRWKIRDVRLGQLGSRVSFQEAFDLFQSHQGSYPDLLLTDCFVLDEFDYPTASSDTPNITPPEVIARTAQNHLFRGHELIFFSLSRHRELQLITDRLMGELRFPVLKNPFSEARHVYPDRQQEMDFEALLATKYDLLSGLLRQKGHPTVNLSSSDTRRYLRIHLYYTDTQLASQLRDFVQAKQDQLIGGRNALTFSRIAYIAK